jgi:hypothetical protein
MFGSKKKHILDDGAQALAVVTNVDYAKVLGGMTVARNYNYKLDLALMVRPDNDAPFEAHVQGYFSQFAQPSVGDQMWVRYDPDDHTNVEIDTAKIAADNAAVEATAAAMAASAVPADLAANGIIGRASLVDVQKTPTGSLIDCEVTLGIRLIDGSAPYRATCHVPLPQDQADRLIPGGTFATVRVDPSNHQRVALSLTEDTPVVPVNDPAIIDPPVRAMSEGAPCRVVILLHQRQWLKNPQGDEFYAVKVRVTSDGSEFQVNVPVPANCVGLLQDGAELPAKRIAIEPNVLMIDWASALAQNTVGNVA